MPRWYKATIFIALLAGIAGCTQPPAIAEPALPSRNDSIGIVTALPLFMAEGGLETAFAGPEPSPLLSVARDHGQPLPLETLNASDLAPLRMLVLAQPRRLGAEELVALDDWVRAGGHLLIFADPMLVWPSAYALGDSRRPPPVSLLDPLFSHWGIELSDADMAAPASVSLTWREIVIQTKRPGEWRARGRACRSEGLVAMCRIGRGRAILVADADLLDGRDAASGDSDVRKLVAMLFTDVRGMIDHGRTKGRLNEQRTKL